MILIQLVLTGLFSYASVDVFSGGERWHILFYRSENNKPLPREGHVTCPSWPRDPFHPPIADDNWWAKGVFRTRYCDYIAPVGCV